MLSRDVLLALNSSPWRGSVTEVGIGVNFINELTLTPGTSRTLIRATCPYHDPTIPKDLRAVSRANVERLAEADLNYSLQVTEDPKHTFGFAISGAHYHDKDANVWMALKTDIFDACMHYSIPKDCDRKTASEIVTRAACWFLEGNLVPSLNWKDHINNFKDIVGLIHVDVLYGRGIGDFERLSFLHPETCLVYHNGRFHRVVDYLRKFPTIFSGSFNPPHKAHMVIGKDCILEITQNNMDKGFVSFEDLMHRAKMIDLLGFPVLLTQASSFLEKDRLVKNFWDQGYTFRVGADTWNRIIDPKYYDDPNPFEAFGKSQFQIVHRPGEEIQINELSDKINHSLYTETPTASSTAIREGDISDLPEPLQMYIEKHQLYFHEKTKEVISG